jgi:hypothetical protein
MPVGHVGRCPRKLAAHFGSDWDVQFYGANAAAVPASDTAVARVPYHGWAYKHGGAEPEQGAVLG